MRRVWFGLAVLVGMGCNVARANGGAGGHAPAVAFARVQAWPGMIADAAGARRGLPMAGPGVGLRASATAEGSIALYLDSTGKVGTRTARRQAASFVAPVLFGGQVPEPVGLLLFGTGLFGAAGLCIYRASRMKRKTSALV